MPSSNANALARMPGAAQLLPALFGVLMLGAQTTASAQTEAPSPARVVIFHIDSLLPDAPERLDLRHWQEVAATGTTVSEMTTILPHHPTISGYFPLATTSLPNPTTAAGSLFLEPAVEATYVQHRLGGHKAFIAGSPAYRSVAEGFNDVFMSRDFTDEDVVSEGLRQLRTHPDLTFLRLVLQNANGPLQQVGFTTDDVAWGGDAYGEGSPYLPVVRRADALLGTFVDGLRELDMWDDTLLILKADGASRVGWHAPQQEESWRLPFVIRGPGVAVDRTVGYAENIDIAPTIAALMGVDAPNADGASGRVLREVFVHVDPATVPAPERRMEQLNRQHREHLRLSGWLQVQGHRFPRLDLAWMAAQNTYAGRPRFWDLHSIDEWPQAASFAQMLADNEAVLASLRSAIGEAGAPPLPAFGAE